MTGDVFLMLVAFGSGIIGGTVGTGSTIILLPILVLQYGPKQAVPIMAISSLMANMSRIAAWRRDVDWRAVAAYGAAGIPAAALGAATLLVLPSHAVDAALGLFFIAMIPGQRYLKAMNLRLKLWQLSIAGAVIGFITGLVISTGPLSVPAFLAYGLDKGPFLATEGAATLLLMITKATTFRELGALPVPAILEGILIGLSVTAGTFVAKAIVLRMSLGVFHRVLDVILLCSGATMLWAALS
ncbi:MAG TPA: sulfite exporter TauE/SafE family protein [Stellaceae bacterium]|jgi:uncharacterized membrane protein YfcA|nr:sulfite exporter TauE/SafE family protein [Stellaceae bacterium]